jgi:hypothetical protein
LWVRVVREKGHEEIVVLALLLQDRWRDSRTLIGLECRELIVVWFLDVGRLLEVRIR